MGDAKVGYEAEQAANKMRYKVYALYGDDKQHLYAGNSNDEAVAITNAISFDAIGIYGRTLVQDSTTGNVVAVFESGKPIDPNTLTALGRDYHGLDHAERAVIPYQDWCDTSEESCCG